MLKLIAFSIIGFTLSATSIASSSYVEGDASVESKVCVLAKEQGLSAARQEAQKYGLTISRFSKSLVCNGKDLRDIAKHATEDLSTQPPAIKLLTDSTTEGSSLCIDAVKNGVKSLGYKARTLRCNGMPVRQFVKEIGDTTI